jgi:hypothetical protein
MSKRNKVLLVGWNPEVVDYSKWPDMNAEKVLTGLNNEKQALKNMGYEPELFFLDNANTAPEKVEAHLQKEKYDCVLVGAGVRNNPDHLVLFEALVNVIHKNAINSKICFNTSPKDTAEAVKRWV